MDFEIWTYIENYFQVFWERQLWLDILIALGIFLVFLLIRGLFTRVIFNLILNLARKTKTNVDAEIIIAFEKPSKTFFIFLGAYLALLYLPLPTYYDLLTTRIFRGLIIVLLAWGGYNLLHPGSFIFAGLQKSLGLEEDQTLIPFISKVIRFVLVALSISVIADEWGYDVNQFVAGLGLGGLAIALAAKDSLSNLFGGAIIIVDKPFMVGDWIYTPSVEGTVEEVSFRTTKVRTFAHALVTVPNAQLAAEPITNWTRMGKRRVSFHLGVTYTTPRDKLYNCVKEIRELLENHPEVHQETIMVRFEQFNDSSLDIFIYFFTIDTRWTEFLRIKEDINFKIMELLEREGVSVAFPSRSLYFENKLIQTGAEAAPQEKEREE